MHLAVGLEVRGRGLADKQGIHDLAFHDRLDAGEQLLDLALALDIGPHLVDLGAEFVDGADGGVAALRFEDIGVDLEGQRPRT